MRLSKLWQNFVFLGKLLRHPTLAFDLYMIIILAITLQYDMHVYNMNTGSVSLTQNPFYVFSFSSPLKHESS